MIIQVRGTSARSEGDVESDGVASEVRGPFRHDADARRSGVVVGGEE